jgi:putative acetyltransferase
VHIRPERAEDAPAVAALNSQAFDGNCEADLIERLHAERLAAVSLVAVEQEVIVGHILFSELAVEVDGRAIRAVALAPMCVRADRRGRGIGAALVSAGLEAVRAARYQAIIVVGHPQYYPRFGFSPAPVEKLVSPFAGDAFMGLELVAGALHGTAGKVTYPAAFGIEG